MGRVNGKRAGFAAFFPGGLGRKRSVFVRKKHVKNTVFFESDGEKGEKALKGFKGAVVRVSFADTNSVPIEPAARG
jgi:hypothetical protein